MKRNWTILSLLALLLVPALACQTVMGGNPTPTLAVEIPALGTVVPPDLLTAVPEGTLNALATSVLGGDAPQDIPIAGTAENLVASAQLVSYETSMSYADVQAFYKDQLKAKGWAEAQASTTFGDITVMNYTKDTRTAVVTVTKTGDKTTVGIVITTQ